MLQIKRGVISDQAKNYYQLTFAFDNHGHQKPELDTKCYELRAVQMYDAQ